MEVVATSKWVRVTPRKARLVAATVTGMPVGDALTLLTFSPRGVAVDVAKVIKSAAANAEHNYNLDASALRISRIEVDGGMVIKRFRPKPRGMAGSIFKRTSHLRAFVTDGQSGTVTRRPAAKAAATATPAPAADPPVKQAPASKAAAGKPASGGATAKKPAAGGATKKAAASAPAKKPASSTAAPKKPAAAPTAEKPAGGAAASKPAGDAPAKKQPATDEEAT
jgi:large subunit ribosomal protein L22